MGFLRSMYSAPCKFLDSGETDPRIVWRDADPLLPVFPFRHRFCPNIYWCESWPHDGLGEVYGGARAWRAGAALPNPGIGLFVGKPLWFQQGTPLVRPPITFDTYGRCVQCGFCWTGPFGYIPPNLFADNFPIPLSWPLTYDGGNGFGIVITYFDRDIPLPFVFIIDCEDNSDGTFTLWVSIYVDTTRVVHQPLIPQSTNPIVAYWVDQDNFLGHGEGALWFVSEH